MKILKITSLCALMMLFASNLSFAQNKYRIHEDVVKPSHVMQYETVVKELLAMIKKHKLEDTQWLASVTNNSHYLYVSPLENMAELDQPSFVAALIEKEGEEAVSNLFKRMDQCYDTELDYIISLDEELTYMPQGFTQTPSGENFRNFHYIYVAPGNRYVVKEKMKAIKDLYQSKGSKLYYRVYRSGFGTDGEYYMVAVAAKDAADMAKKDDENQALLGADGQKVMGEMYSNVLKYVKVEGEIRPDLGYSPQQ